MRDALNVVDYIEVVRVLEHYPTDVELSRAVRATGVQVVFLSAESLQDALKAAKQIDHDVPGLPVIGTHSQCEQRTLLELMRVGVREFLYPPFSTQLLYESLTRVQEFIGRTPPAVPSTDLVLSFLPSKPGVGTSTIALNAAAALAGIQDGRVLIADFDLNSGMVGFMLKIESPYSVTNAAESSSQLDENLWSQLVTSSGQLDALPSGKLNPGFRVEPVQIHNLMDFARRHYRAIFLDMSGNMEKYSIELMHESKKIYLVCTQELPSLHLAREKLSYLRTLELEDKVVLVLNRTQPNAVIDSAEVEKLLGHPVEMAFPNDYAGVHKALASGCRIHPSSELGAKFRAMAESILTKKRPEKEQKRRFVEYFSLLPARYLFSHGEKKSET